MPHAEFFIVVGPVLGLPLEVCVHQAFAAGSIESSVVVDLPGYVEIPGNGYYCPDRQVWRSGVAPTSFLVMGWLLAQKAEVSK